MWHDTRKEECMSVHDLDLLQSTLWKKSSCKLGFRRNCALGQLSLVCGLGKTLPSRTLGFPVFLHCVFVAPSLWVISFKDVCIMGLFMLLFGIFLSFIMTKAFIWMLQIQAGRVSSSVKIFCLGIVGCYRVKWYLPWNEFWHFFIYRSDQQQILSAVHTFYLSKELLVFIVNCLLTFAYLSWWLEFYTHWCFECSWRIWLWI